jgi:hypothetical protein
MMNEKLQIDEEATEDEMLLTAFLMEGIATYVENKATDTCVLITALFEICKIVFSHQTSLNVKEQCNEIDLFCNLLKEHAMRHAVKE